MAHNVFGIKLSRDTNQRQALLKGLVGALIRSERIETTAAKATATKSLVEKLVTKARRATLNDIRLIESVVSDRDLVSKLVHDIAPRLSSRPGGYTRLIKLGNRAGDNAPMVRMEFVTDATPAPTPSPKTKAKPKPKAK
jgi:large subunit ribosomal protein L17